MTPSKPYLIRAFYEWIIDNGLTPYIAVDATFPRTHLPMRYVEDGRIVLNISPDAANGLLISNDAIEFTARFGGVATPVYFPVGATLAIYARENGRGMIFEEEEGGDGGGDKPEKRSQPPKLTIVK